MNRPQPGRSPVRHLPNALSAARIACFPALVALAALGREGPFQWLLLAALLSDILDGLIARWLGLQSPLGATLDSLADALTTGGAAWGVWRLHPEFVREHGVWVLLVLGLWALEMAASFWRYGRLSSFHTYAMRAGAYLLGIFVMALFIWGFNRWLFAAAVVVNVAAHAEEFLLLWLLPTWTPDVGSAWRVLRGRKG